MTRPTAAALSLALLALAGGPARGATLELAPTGQIQVRAKGAVDPEARVYRSLEPPLSMVVYAATFRRPVFVTTVPRAARLVDPGRIREDAETGTIRLDTGGPQEDLLVVRVDGPNLVVEQDGAGVALAAPEPVLGDRTLDEMTRLLPEYRRSAARYTPDAATLERLRRIDQPAELIVFFGSWCPHCEQMVPRLLRVLQDAGTLPLEVRFHGLPPGGAGDALANQYRITGLPTCVVRRGTTEVARLVDDDWDAPEKSLATALTARPPR